MQKTISLDKNHFPTLSFWKSVPTKSIVSWKQHDNKNKKITKEVFSHVATDTVYFYDLIINDETKEEINKLLNDVNSLGCVTQKFSYDSDDVLQDPDELEEFPIQVEFSDEAIENYVLIPVQFFDQVVDDFKNGKIKLYEDYMDQGWGEVVNIEYLYVENGDNTISYINGEGVWMLYEEMLKYDPMYDELFGMCLCKIEKDEDDDE